MSLSVTGLLDSGRQFGWPISVISRHNAIPLFAALILALMVGCSVSPPEDTRPTAAAPAQQNEEARLQNEYRLLMSLVAKSERAIGDIELLSNDKPWVQRGYFTSAEHDHFEKLLFDFHLVHDALLGMVKYYAPSETDASGTGAEARGFMHGMSAALYLDFFTMTFVSSFSGDEMAQGKLNESFYRSHIPEGSYAQFHREATNPEIVKKVRVAWQLYATERDDNDSGLHALISNRADYAQLDKELNALYEKIEPLQETMLDKEGGIDPATRASLSSSEIGDLSRELSAKNSSAMAAIQAELFTDVSRLHKPGAGPLYFSPEQREAMHALLVPGDIILTYTAGYMSNVFLPGAFKHGITYVGSVEQRKAAGLFDIPDEQFSPQDTDQLLEKLARDSTANGRDADLIEAVSEGVKFSNLNYLLDTHINRMVIIRPSLVRQEQAEALWEVFRYQGADYDFDFDFSDASKLCCTEVIYRSLNGRQNIDMSLNKRAGRFTLSADDILAYYLKKPDQFSIILLALEDSNIEGNAVLYEGVDSFERLRGLLDK
ncbi:MAG: YiiX/YebB-like N1pC/P60 family cysteine hydrolase [Halioglobus sp.]